MLLGLPMHELANVVVPIDAVLPPGFDQLPEQLAVASSWEQRFELLDSLLVARLAQARTAVGRRCLGVERARALAGPGADRLDLRSARAQPQTSRCPLP